MKKLFAATLAAIMVLGMTACQSQSNTNPSTQGSTSEEQGISAPANGAADDPIKIGLCAPLTGGSSNAGIALKNGAQLAIDQVNEAGGVLGGRMLELVSYDDKGTPEEAVKIGTKLIQSDKVSAILGSTVSPNITPLGPIMDEYEIPLMGSGSASVWLQQGYQYLFRTMCASSVNTEQIAKFINDNGWKNIVMLASNNEFGTSGVDDLTAALEKYAPEAKLTVVERFTPGDRDFTAQLANMFKTQPDAVVGWALAEEAGFIIKAVRQHGFEGPIIGSEAFTQREAIEAAGDAGYNIFAPGICLIPETIDEVDGLPTNEHQKAFLKVYAEKYGALPINDCAMRGYDGANIIIEGIKLSNSDVGKDIRNAIAELENYEGVSGTFTYKGGVGEGLSSANIFEIKNGKYLLAA